MGPSLLKEDDKYGMYVGDQLFMIEPHQDDTSILDIQFGDTVGGTSDQLRYALDSRMQVQFKR